MKRDDEKELHRLSKMLHTIDQQLEEASPLREAVVKAGFALCFGFIHGFRSKIEKEYDLLKNAHEEFRKTRAANSKRGAKAKK